MDHSCYELTDYSLYNPGCDCCKNIKHLITLIVFRAISKGQIKYLDKIKIGTTDKISIETTDYILTLADRDNIVNEGKMTCNGDNMVDVVLNDEEGSNGLTRTYTIKGTHTSSNPLRIGHEILVPEDAAYYITVTMKKGNGNDCSPTGYWKLEPEGGFKAGKTYWVDLIISNNPEEASGGVLTID